MAESEHSRPEFQLQSNFRTDTSYTWSAPYVTGGDDDFSSPSDSLLPVLVVAETYDDFLRPGAVDLYFENFLSSGDFSEGTILTLNFSVPNDYALGATVISTIPDTFDDGFASIATAGGQLTVVAIPEPMNPLALGFAGLFLGARRKRRRLMPVHHPA